MDNDLKDRELIEAFKDGDNDAFEILFLRHSEFIKKYINKFVRNIDTAEEIMQEVFIILYKNPEKYNGNSKVINYIVAIARNRTLTYLRDTKLRAEKFKLNAKELYGDKISASALNIIERKEDREEVNKVLNNMNLTYKTAIILIDYHELSYKDAAEIMGKSLVQMKAIIHRARKKFEEDMNEKFPHTVEKYSKKKFTTLQIFLAIIIGMSMVTGLVYATIKIFEHYQEKRETFQLREKEEMIDESQVEISREHAKEIIDLYLKTLGCSGYDLDSITLEKDVKINSMKWILENNDFEIWIDSNTGKLISYNFYDISNLREISYTNKSEEEIKQNVSEIYTKLKLEEDYELYNIEKYMIEDKPIYEFFYCKKYNDVYNIYESVVIEYFPKNNLIKDIVTYNYKYRDEEIKISESDVRQLINDKKLGEIKEIQLEIKDVNIIYNNCFLSDAEVKEALIKEYNVDSILELRKIWKVTLENGNIIYVDSITGDFINNDSHMIQEEKY